MNVNDLCRPYIMNTGVGTHSDYFGTKIQQELGKSPVDTSHATPVLTKLLFSYLRAWM